ncbi:Clp protease N-terminal domain-containing protein [Actinomycetospora straminea]|uniref:Clp R domain-containing protein n=1 Tax=Actinomycetospora straminea TaxID=663607 RepID=A0ABP9E0M4_9PSEU|nr:Clp protease N-terminal domain-containing protein [Actinomycetospora straminea]MDD7931074.1 Clp protease N-terminal domain-containing protein [Actinomycetospora straminea]
MGTTTPIHDALAGVRREVPAKPTPFPRGRTPAPRTRRSVAEDTERVVALAWQEADERGHAVFGTGHLLLGLVRAGGPEAGLLAATGVTASTADAAMALVELSSVSEPVVHGHSGPGRGAGPVAGPTVAEVLSEAAAAGDTGAEVTAGALLTALAARPWGQVAEMLAALGVDSSDLAAAVTTLAAAAEAAGAADGAGAGDTPARPVPRDPSGLLSSAWRRPAPEATPEIA